MAEALAFAGPMMSIAGGATGLFGGGSQAPQTPTTVCLPAASGKFASTCDPALCCCAKAKVADPRRLAAPASTVKCFIDEPPAQAERRSGSN